MATIFPIPRGRFIIGSFLVGLCISGPVRAQVSFSELGAAEGVLPSTPPGNMMAMGVAAADYDDDGYVDLFVPNGPGAADQLYHNLGNGQLQEIAAAAGVASLLLSRGALWFDYDGDHDLDLLVTREDAAAIFTFYRQTAPGVFEDVTAAAGLALASGPLYDTGRAPQRSGACAGDINGDGYVDFCVTMWNGIARLFLNQRDGTFSEITSSSGLGPTPGYYWQPMMADFDGDGWLDIYIAVDFLGNQLWINQKDGTFVDSAAAANLADAWNDMGLTLGDYDNDGDLDIYISNIEGYVNNVHRYNLLYRNDSLGASLSFADVSQAAQVETAGWAWGVTFFDADRDGWLDIGVTNDTTSGASGGGQDITTSRFYHNPGGSPFVFAEQSAAVGFNDAFLGSGLIAFDYERDGDLDLVEACMDHPTRILANQPTGPALTYHFLTIRPRMNGPNHRALGTVVRCSAGGLSMMRLITAGTSCMSQEPAEAFFGLNAATAADTVTIEWPDGTQTALINVAADQALTVTHGGFGDLDADGDVDDADLGLFLACYTGPTGGGILYGAGCRAADFDVDGDVDCDDYSVFRAAYTASSGGVPLLAEPDFVAVLLGAPNDPAHGCVADMNIDGIADGLDIAPFADALLAP